MIPQSHKITANPTNPQFFQNPYKTYAKYRNRRLFFWDHYKIWCATSFSLVDTLLRDRRFARVLSQSVTADLTPELPPRQTPRLTPSSTPGMQDPSEADPLLPSHLVDFRAVEAFSLLNLEPPQHTRLRSRLNHAFAARQIKDMEADIERLARTQLAQLRPTGKADLLPHFATPIPATTIARMIGVPDHRIDDLLRWSHAMVKVYTLTQSYDDEVQANSAAAEFAEYLRGLIRQKSECPEQDLLSHLIHAPDGSADAMATTDPKGSASSDTLSDDELISLTILLLNAGHEATVHQIGNALKTLIECKTDIAELFATPEQRRATVTELMRYDAPLHLFLRYATCDVTIDDVTIKAGEQIGLCLGAANRDPERFTNPDTFDPFRSDGASVSLGAGVHFCVGAQLARLELETSLPLAFDMLPGLRLQGKPAYRDSFHFHGLEQLQVSWNID
ncbi:MAG: cytochrome P450 [Gammaproteobacteria bacterium]|nr:cytochrome P450 [Gammaproteobacteria bacterium]